MNHFDTMTKAMSEAEHTFRAADAVTDRLAKMLAGRLKKVWSTSALIELKKELKDFNIHTRRWK